MHLVHLASRIYGTPLLIERSKLDVILSVLGPRIGLPDIDAAVQLPPAKAIRQIGQPGIAVIPVHGTLVRRVMGLEAASGLMAYGDIAASIDDAVADPLVRGILLDIDSPGGEVSGVFELAERIRAASSVKPIWAHANDAAFSAAYAIAAACQRLTLSQTAGVGSIGVIALHVDQSVMDAKEGLKYTAIFAGSHKNDFSPHEPLSPQAAAVLQAEVDRVYDIFVNHVGRMRGIDTDAVRATEAGLFYGEHAVAAGLADAVMSLEQVLTEFADSLAVKQRLAQPGVARAALRGLSTRPVSTTSRRESKTKESIMTDAKDKPDMIDHADTDQHGDMQHTDVDTQLTPDAKAALADAFASGRSQAQAIAELCLIAGQPHRTADFIASGLTEAQVRRALLEARADQPEISSRITADAGNSQRLERNPMIDAVHKITIKEKE